MPEVPTQAVPPTIYANLVTVSVDPDVVYIELRQFIVPHRDVSRVPDSSGGPQVLPTSQEAVFAEKPIARVVLTYTAARGLKANLDELLPKMLAARQQST